MQESLQHCRLLGSPPRASWLTPAESRRSCNTTSCPLKYRCTSLIMPAPFNLMIQAMYWVQSRVRDGSETGLSAMMIIPYLSWEHIRSDKRLWQPDSLCVLDNGSVVAVQSWEFNLYNKLLTKASFHAGCRFSKSVLFQYSACAWHRGTKRGCEWHRPYRHICWKAVLCPRSWNNCNCMQCEYPPWQTQRRAQINNSHAWWCWCTHIHCISHHA